MDDRNKKIVAIGAGLAAGTVCCVVALLIFVVIDPFGWFGGLLGGRDPIARVMPADTDFYVGMNLARLLSSDAEAVVTTILESIPGMEPRDLDDMLDDMISDIFSDYDMSFSSDVGPWLGQYAGLSISNLRIDRYGDITEPDMVFAIEVRDRRAADDFIVDYIDGRERALDETYRRDDYRGVEIYELEGRYLEEAIGRSGDVLFFGSSAYAVESAIDAQKGDSLADEAEYERISSRLPNGRFLTLYIGSDFLGSYGEILGVVGGPLDMGSMQFESIAISLTIADFGLQLDSVAGIDEDALDDAQFQWIDSLGVGGDLIAMLPEDTVGFFVGQGLDLVWEGIEQSMELSYGGDFDEAMEFFFDEFGIRPDIDLFPILDGDWAVALLAGSNTGISSELGANLMLLAESSEEDEIEATAGDMAWGLERSGLAMREIEASGGTIYVAQDGGTEIFSFGTHEGVLFLGSDSEFILDAMEGTSSIEDDRDFRDVWEAFPRGTTPVLYMDLHSLLDDLMDRGDYDWDELAWEVGINPRPFTHFAAGSGGYSRGSIRATFVIFIDTE